MTNEAQCLVVLIAGAVGVWWAAFLKDLDDEKPARILFWRFVLAVLFSAGGIALIWGIAGN